MRLLVVLIISMFWLQVMAGNPSGKKKAKRPLPDTTSRSIEQWATLPLDTLKLHCEVLCLDNSGDTDTLATRLYQHYHGDGASSSVMATGINTIPSSTPAITPLDNLLPVMSDATSDSFPFFSASDGGIDFSIAPMANTDPSFAVPKVKIRRTSLHQDANSWAADNSGASSWPNVPDIPTTSWSGTSDQPGPSHATADPVVDGLRNQVQSLQQQVAQLTNTITTFVNNIGSNGRRDGHIPSQLPPHTWTGTFNGANPIPALDPRPLPVGGTRNLPAIPLRILQYIARGLFVSFDAIYASTSQAAAARAADRTSLFSLALSVDDIGGPAIDVLPRAATSRDRVTNFHSWSVAFNVFMRCAIHFRPHLTTSLIRYQGLIAGFANSYAASAWLAYDIAFRHLVANDPGVPWDRVDEETFTVHLRSAPPLPRCFTCHATGHLAQQCTRRASASGSRSAITSTPGLSASSSRSVPSALVLPSQASRGPSTGGSLPICFNWNGRGGCTRQPCRFLHRCSQCGLDHPRSACPRSGRH